MAGALPPSSIPSNAIAAIVGAGVKNKQFKPSANTVPRKILIVGSGDDALTALLPEDKPYLVTSAEQVATLTGRGFMLHRLAMWAFAGSKGIETYIAPQQEAGATVQADGSVTFAGAATATGTLHIYISGIHISVPVPDTTTAVALALLVVAAINADLDLPVTAAVNGGVPEQVDLTAKSGGPGGNAISIEANLGFQQELPIGITIGGMTPMASGAEYPDIDAVLTELGEGDEQNQDNFTAIIHGYHADIDTYDWLSNYNGVGNDFVGNYSKTVSRPFRCLDGDVTAGSAGLTALIAITDLRKTDRTNGILAAPDSPNHPSEIAAFAMGLMENTSNNRAEESYIDLALSGILIGDSADRWGSQYSNRDLAVKNGISPTLVADGVMSLQNVVTFYRPEAVPVDSNGYRSQRNIAITQNVLFNNKLNFSQEKWKRISIVADVTKISNMVDREKARDVDSVLDDLLALATAYEGKAWIFTAAFTISELQKGGRIEIRPGATGFNISFPVIYSGEGGIIDHVTEFDISLAVLA